LPPEVRDTIRAVKPDAVFVELCQQRAAILRKQTSKESDSSFQQDIAQALAGSGPLSEKLMKLAGRVHNRFYSSFGLKMGEEFQVAMQEADAIGARLIFGDRPQEETIHGILKGLDFARVLRMLSGQGAQVDPQLLKLQKEASNLEEAVEAFKTRRAVRALVGQMEENLPGVARALIHERDEIMTRRLAKETGRIVAVVGLGHLDGIERLWPGLTAPMAIAPSR